MKRFTKALVTGAVVGGFMALGVAPLAGADSTTTTTTVAGSTTTTVAPTTTTTKAPFVNGNKYMSFTVQTVTGGGSAAGSVYPGSCILENVFGQGAVIVFRMWGTDFERGGVPLTGGAATNPDVQSVTINGLPGVTTAPTMNYATNDGYWTYGWHTTAATVPVGNITYSVTVVLDPVNAVYKHVVKMVNGKRKSVKVLVSASVPAETLTYTPPSTQQLVIEATL